jgi:hypothetical protein
MTVLLDKYADFSSVAPALNMTEADLRLDAADITALDSNYFIDTYQGKVA